MSEKKRDAKISKQKCKGPGFDNRTEQPNDLTTKLIFYT
jgi:hypothetical protein